MNYDATLRALMEDAAPSLRHALQDAIVETIVDDQRSPIFDLLRKAYELGYREALASARSHQEPASAPAPSPVATGTTSTEPSAADDDDFEPDLPGDALFTSDPDPDDIEEDPISDGTHASPGATLTRPGSNIPSQHPPSSDPTASPSSDEERSDINWNLVEDNDGSPEPRARTARRDPPKLRVRSSLTIGGLRDRILKVFELDRFDIDVIICRKGDRSRRQLKSSVRLSKYEAAG